MSKPEIRTKYAAGVVIDGCTWTERKNGNLMGVTYNVNDAKLFSTKQAAKNRAELIASRFSKSEKAQPFISGIRVSIDKD